MATTSLVRMSWAFLWRLETKHDSFSLFLNSRFSCFVILLGHWKPNVRISYIKKKTSAKPSSLSSSALSLFWSLHPWLAPFHPSLNRLFLPHPQVILCPWLQSHIYLFFPSLLTPFILRFHIVILWQSLQHHLLPFCNRHLLTPPPSSVSHSPVHNSLSSHQTLLHRLHSPSQSKQAPAAMTNYLHFISLYLVFYMGNTRLVRDCHDSLCSQE